MSKLEAKSLKDGWGMIKVGKCLAMLPVHA